MSGVLRTVLSSLLGTVLALVLVLWGYEHFVLQPRETARASQLERAVQQATASEVDRRLGEVQAVGKSLQASVDDSIKQVRQSLADETTLMHRRAQVTEGLVRASMFKLSIAESYMSMGRWPASADEAGLPAPESAASASVRSIGMRADGVVEIAYTDAVAKGAVLRLIPSVQPDFSSIDWRCEASGFEDPGLVPLACR